MGAALALDRAAEGNDWAGLRQVPVTAWVELGAAADAGADFRVQSGELAAGVAVSLRERNNNFVDAIQALVAR